MIATCAKVVTRKRFLSLLSPPLLSGCEIATYNYILFVTIPLLSLLLYRLACLTQALQVMLMQSLY